MYLINEIFETIQGEGYYTGTPAIFVRVQGCPVGCSWCDTQHTWDIKTIFKTSLEQVIEKPKDSSHYAEAFADDIWSTIQQRGYQAKHIVLTGGEPCTYNLNPLCELLHQQGYSTQIETSGTFEIQAPISTWVTVSPKLNMKGGYPVLDSALQRADELKHPVARWKHVEELEQLIHQHQLQPKFIYLQPISQKEKATAIAMAACIQHNWRLSLQMHKYIGIN